MAHRLRCPHCQRTFAAPVTQQRRGGKARAAHMTPEQRSASARAAAQARWAQQRAAQATEADARHRRPSDSAPITVESSQ